jgi:hypothetical protein
MCKIMSCVKKGSVSFSFPMYTPLMFFPPFLTLLARTFSIMLNRIGEHAWAQWLTHVIPANWEVEIRKNMTQG